MHPIYQRYGSPEQTNNPLIMGILNITPDSFFDGDHYNSKTEVTNRAEHMVDAGVDILDVGGESTRPGANVVTESEEIDRVVPVIEQIRQLGVPISIDTSKPLVMKAAVAAGANMINDVRALQVDGALSVALELEVPICLMHMQGNPEAMQKDPQYRDVVDEVSSFLMKRVIACEEAGIDKDLISIDPGFGFGKTLKHNLVMLNNLDRFVDLGLPVLVGLSRKSMLGEITGKSVDQRLSSSLAVALVAMQKGARIIRVHDVDESCDIRKIYMAIDSVCD